MTNETKKKETPPYIAFSTFMSFIKGLSKTGIPSRIDKSLLRNMSGGNQSALLAALKWFKLIDDVGQHGVPLEALVSAGDDVGVVLSKLLPPAYKFMEDGSIQLDRATGAQVEEKFRAYGLTGSTIVKAMAFFISACKEAGIPLSAHVKLPKVVRAAATPKTKKNRSTSADESRDEQNDDDEDDGADKQHPFITGLLQKLPAAESEWPIEARAKWLTTASNIFDLMYSTDSDDVKYIVVEVKRL